MIKNQERNFYLPPEFCLIDGVTDDIKKSRGMRDALAQTRIRPDQKCARIEKMVMELFDQKCIKDWGLTLDKNPIHLKTQVMCPPKIIRDNKIIHCDE